MVKRIDYTKGRTCPCKKRDFWNCNDQQACPQAVLELMKKHNIKITPVLLVSDLNIDSSTKRGKRSFIV